MSPHWTIVAIAIAAMLVAAATAGVVPFVLQKVGDDVFVAKNEALVFVLPAFLVIAVLVRAVADWVSTVAEASLGSKIVAEPPLSAVRHHRRRRSRLDPVQPFRPLRLHLHQ